MPMDRGLTCGKTRTAAAICLMMFAFGAESFTLNPTLPVHLLLLQCSRDKASDIEEFLEHPL